MLLWFEKRFIPSHCLRPGSSSLDSSSVSSSVAISWTKAVPSNSPIVSGSIQAENSVPTTTAQRTPPTPANDNILDDATKKGDAKDPSREKKLATLLAVARILVEYNSAVLTGVIDAAPPNIMRAIKAVMTNPHETLFKKDSLTI